MGTIDSSVSLQVVMSTQHPEVLVFVAPTMPTFDHVVDLEDDGRTPRHSAPVPVSRQDAKPRPVPGRSARRPGASHADPTITPEYDHPGADTGAEMPAHTAMMLAARASSRLRARRPP